MSTLDLHETFEQFKSRTLEGISSHFPMKGRVQTIHLDKLEVKDDIAHDDIKKQYDAKVSGGNFAVPVYAHVRMVDNNTGQVVDQRKIRVADIPKITQRYSYILNGAEYQVDNQWQLKPAAYTRRRQSGELETRFNVVDKPAFDVVFDPETKVFQMHYGKAKLPLYPLMKSLGVDDDTLERHLGKDIVEANRKARGVDTTLQKFYKSDKKIEPNSKEEAAAHFAATMAASRMRPEANALTLGKPISNVTGEALLLSAQKLIKVQGGHPEDDRDSLVFKDLRNIGDFAHDKIKASSKVISDKVSRKINTAKDIRDVLTLEMFQEPIRQSFNKNSAARIASQINPVEMIASSAQTTIMGSGGIKSENQIVDEAKLINPSHFGYLDPIATPEGSRTGITLRLPIGVKKVGHEPHIPLYNLKTQTTEFVPPDKFLQSHVVMPDQVTWKDGKPQPVSRVVKVSGTDNDFKEIDFKDAQYVMKHPSQLLNITSNLIPFVNNTQGNRASMASRHIEQAISLVHREAPLVQVGTGVDQAHLNSFERVVGSQAGHVSPVAGKVVKVDKHEIHIKDPKGVLSKVPVYHHFPLNDSKSTLHSTPIVKVGDNVTSGQVVADTNYTKNGVLALGNNLRVGYVPYQGYNFEDGIVISETAAKKLASQHLYKKLQPLQENTILDRNKFLVHHPTAFTKDQIKNIDSEGVAVIGSKVKPGDPLILSMRPFEVRDKTGMQLYRKGINGGHTDTSLHWDGDAEGEVVAVTKNNEGIHVHVKTIEPMQVGDKLSGRSGNKGIVAKILTDHEMPHSKDGKPLEVLLNPTGVGGRINPSQLLETAASKIAEKTGKPFIVKSFEHGVDSVAHIQNELKKHGLSDTEELIDPITKNSIGHAMVGKQYMIKLVHQVDKKVKVTPGMSIPGEQPDTYDLNLQPTSGQRIGSLGMYALLAHGAKANIREMQTYKGEGQDPQLTESKRWPSQHLQVWNAIQTGTPLPTPKPSFAFKKFEELLRGAGVNMEKKGHELILSPLTSQQIKSLTGDRILTSPGERLEAKVDKKTGELKPRKGGLFDEKLTGGHGGKLWSAIPIAEPMPNPVFEAPIKALTGLSQKDFDALMSGQKGINAHGQLTEFSKGLMTGGVAINHMLQNIDVPKALEASKKELIKASPDKIDSLVKKVKYLRALDQLGMKPHDAYVMTTLPVLPPAMRPVSIMQDGNIKYADVNEVYKNFALLNDKLKDPLTKILGEQEHRLRAHLYDGLKAVTGYGVPYADAKYKGLLHQISGASPKTGFFQSMVMQKRQDLTMRSTIVPEPAMSIDEVGIPKDHALKLFSPFVVKKMLDMGTAANPLEARKLIGEKHQNAFKALQKVVEERPVLMKRDPALHKYSVQGFQPKIVEGNAIRIHPLVCGGLNADFDGDSVLGHILLAYTYDSTYKEGGGFDMPHLGDIASIETIDLKDFPHIKESVKTTANGVREYEVPSGLYVPAYTTNGVKLHPVVSYSVHPNCEEWFVTSACGREITCSSDHSLALLDMDTLEVIKKTPKEAVGLCFPVLRNLHDEGLVKEFVGSYVSSPKAIQMLESITLDFDCGWFIGASIGDGWVTHTGNPKFQGQLKETSDAENSAIHISYGKNGDDVAGLWAELATKYSNGSKVTKVDLPHEFEGKTCISYRLTVSSTALAKWLLPLIGKLAKGKHLPKDFLYYSEECRRGLFCGLLDTDGTVSKVQAKSKNKPQYQIAYTTISKELAYGIQLLGLSLGLVSNINISERHGKFVYLISFSGRCIQDAVWMRLYHRVKDSNLREFQSLEKVDYGRNDIVPLPKKVKVELLGLIRELGGTKRPENRDTVANRATSLYSILSRATSTITRISVGNILDLFGLHPNLSEFSKRWLTLVTNQRLGWDLVEEAKPTGRVVEMYDLTVPGSWTFTMANGAVVWDTMSLFVPISSEAVDEAHKMKPSNNLFAESSGRIAYAPTLESALGIYKLGVVGKQVNQSFTNPGQVLDLVKSKKLNYTDVITLNGKKTTAGRIMLATTLPVAMQDDVLHKLDTSFDKKGLDNILHTLGKNHKEEFDKSINKLKDIGNTTSSGSVSLNVGAAKPIFVPMGVHTLSLKDIQTDKPLRTQVLNEADKKVEEIRKGNISEAEKNRRQVEVYRAADIKLREAHELKMNNAPSNLYTMYKAGIKPGWDQYKQIVLAPMLLRDSTNRIIPNPVKNNYSEGLDVADYWTGMHGARRGAVMKVQEVQEPGYMSKLLMNTMMDNLITSNDCGTTRGVVLPVHEKDIHDRVLVNEFKHGDVHVAAGSVLTPALVSQIKAVDKNAKLMVRSPLKCEHEKGVCQKCAGLSSNGRFYDLGTNIGVHAAQTVGERAVQLTLKSFHSGGTVEQGKGGLLNSFARFEQLTTLPKQIPNAASLAMHTGTIDKIEHTSTGTNIFINGQKHFVGKDVTGNPLHQPLPGSQWPGLKVGMKLNAGDHLSDPGRTYVNPHDLYKATGSIDKVQNHMTSEIYDLYRDEGIKRRHVETLVKSMSNLTKVENPGDAHGILHGEFQPLSVIQKQNIELMKAGKNPIEHKPVLKGVNVLPLFVNEDWMAKLQHQKLRNTIAEAAAMGAKANIHGTHPVPAIAYGAEIGLTEAKSKIPGFGHLINVPKHNY